MDRQVEMTDGGTVNEAAGDHDPACKCLGDEERSHYKVNAKFFQRNGLFEQEIENRNSIDQPSKTGDEAMDPFDVEDILVFFQGYIGIDLLEFGRLLIFRKFHLPGLFPYGWHCSTDWIPFRD